MAGLDLVAAVGQAIRDQDVFACKFLLEAGGCPCALHAACREPNEAIFRMCLEHTDDYSSDCYGEGTPLVICATFGRTSYVSALLKVGARVDLLAHHKSSVYWAMHHNKFATFCVLLRSVLASAKNEEDHDEKRSTLPHLSDGQHDSPDNSSGDSADSCTEDSGGDSADVPIGEPMNSQEVLDFLLCQISQRGLEGVDRPRFVKKLLQEGASPMSTYDRQWAAVYYQSISCPPPIKTPFGWFVQHSNFRSARLLNEYVDEKFSNGETCLVNEIKNIRPSNSVLRFLLRECKADVNACDALGRSAFMLWFKDYAGVQRSDRVFTLFVECGANIFDEDMNGDNALVLADRKLAAERKRHRIDSDDDSDSEFSAMISKQFQERTARLAGDAARFSCLLSKAIRDATPYTLAPVASLIRQYCFTIHTDKQSPY